MLRMGLVGRHHTVFYCVCVLQPHSSVFVDKHFPQVSYDGADDDTSPPQPVVVVMQLAQLGLYNSTLSLAHRKSCFHCTAISGTHQHPFIVSLCAAVGGAPSMSVLTFPLKLQPCSSVL